MNGLKVKREEKKMTRRELGEKIGMNAKAIYRYENGEREPNLETLKKMAECLNCSVDELL